MNHGDGTGAKIGHQRSIQASSPCYDKVYAVEFNSAVNNILGEG